MSTPETAEDFQRYEAGLAYGGFSETLAANIENIRGFSSEDWVQGSSRDGVWEQLEDFPGVIYGSVAREDPAVDPDLVDQLASRLNKYDVGNPAAFDTLVEALGSEGGLSDALPGRVESEIRTAVAVYYAELDDLLLYWSGTAANEFKTNYLAHWPIATEFQLRYLRQIEYALRSYQLLMYKARHDVVEIASDTVGALSLLKGEYINSSAGSDVSNITQSQRYTILGAIATVLGAPALVGVAISVASAFDPATTGEAPTGEPSSLSAFEDANGCDNGDNERRTIQGDTKEQIIRSALNKLDTVDALVEEEEGRIRNAAIAAREFASGDGTRNLELVAPSLLDTYQGGMGLTGYFEPVEPLQHFPADGRLDADLVFLNQAGQLVLPAMAYQYDYARLILRAVQDGMSEAFGAPGLFDPMAARTLCGRLAVILQNTRDNLAAAGECVVGVARQYAELDGYSAEQLTNTLGGSRYDDPPALGAYGDWHVLGQDTPTEPDLF